LRRSWESLTMRALFAAAGLLALAACNKPARPAAAPVQVVVPPPVAPVAAQPAAAVNPPVIITNYACAGGKMLEAGYPSATTAVVIWQGHAYTLNQATAASGARYTGFGLQWWSKGVSRANLATLKEGEEIATDPGLECVAQLGAVTPPAPGTVGGLPDDKTPISEAPSLPTSAQGAANVVQTYYALIERRSSVEAARHRTDGQPENLSQYASVRAQVGAPGAIRAAAGSLYVEVPVVLSGRLTEGQPFRRSGKVTLTRSSDSTAPPAQQEWRIDRFDLK
jgi:membrane-bound inhibitor of C-type lysozyme